MKIDIYCHILPPKYRDALYATGKIPEKQKQSHETVPMFSDLECRFREMAKYEDLTNVLSLVPPAIEAYIGPDLSPRLAEIANDEIAELVQKYPDKFIAGVASLPMNNLDATMIELDRIAKIPSLKGVQIYTPIADKPLDSPEFMPLFDKLERYKLPIWLHPQRMESYPDYRTDKKSRYEGNKIFGWPYETSIAMLRFVYSGIMEKHPNLKILTHHAGGMIPYFERRIERFYELNNMRQWGDYEPRLPKPPMEYFKMFYNDTAVDGNTAALMCAHAFFGADHIIFGTDMHTAQQIGETIKSIENMNISAADKKKIFEDNARKLLSLK